MILVDASGVLAGFEVSNRHHARALQELEQPRVRSLSPFVLAELDYLVTKYAGTGAALTLLDDVSRGVYALEPFTNEDVAAASAIVRRYHDLGIGLADASIVVLAERHGCTTVLTLDGRHFRAMTTGDGTPFHLPLLDPAF